MLETKVARKVVEAKAVRQKRIVPGRKHAHLDPFIRVDHFCVDAGGFSSQIHHGFEGLFYLFSGSIHHEDSLGNFFDIEAGGAELFTAGQGLQHSELAEGKAHGIRIWIDLPEDLKHMKPFYQRVEASEIPIDENGRVLVRHIVGKASPIKPKANVEILDVTLCSQSVYKYDIPQSFQGFLYVVVGEVKIRGKVIAASEMVYVRHEKDLAILSTKGARILIAFGQPHGSAIRAQASQTQ